MATLTMNGSPDDTQEAKSPNIPSAIPLVVKNGILDCTRTAVDIVKNAVGSCLVAGALALGSAPAMSADQQDAAVVLQSQSAEDVQLITELKTLGYSSEETLRISQLMANSRRFTKELGLSVPLVSMGFTPTSDKVSDRLRIMNKDFENLSNLKSKTIEQAIWVETITPENIKQVLTKIHTLDAEEKTAMYGNDTVRSWAGERTRERQKKGWIDRNLPRIPAADLEKACQTANTWLANAEYISNDVARIIITTVLDLYTPAPDYGATPTEAQKITLANRPLNFAQSIAWMTAIAKPGVAYRANNKEIITVTVNDITYSFAPESRVQWIPGIPVEFRWITNKAYNQLQTAQNSTIAYNKEMNGMNAVIADSKAVIADSKAVIADSKAVIADSKAVITQLDISIAKKDASIAKKDASIADSKAVIAQLEQHALIIVTTDSVRERLLPLMASYLSMKDPEQRKIIHKNIELLAWELRKAELTIKGIKPLSDINAQEIIKNIKTIGDLYVQLRSININIINS
jgi:hypothetical protein